MKKKIGVTLIIISIGLIFFILIIKLHRPSAILSASWNSYKENYLYPDGRIIDPYRGDVTISEGQSYAMLRSVWMNDKKTFDLVWNWTKSNLKREDDHLLAWKWGKKKNGTYGFVETTDKNSASDADCDIGLALIFAYELWHDKTYLEDVNKLLPDIWKLETIKVGKKRYMTAGNWAQVDNNLYINPSYFSPYSWRIFALYDVENNWLSLVDPSYELLEQTSIDKLGDISASGLPPDWIVMDKKTGIIHPTGVSSMNTDFSYDAFRVPWRIALDYEWNKEEKAKTYLIKAFSLLSKEYKSSHKLSGSYTHAGRILKQSESATLYAASLAYFRLTDKKMAQEIYENKILKLYTNYYGSFNHHLTYYDQNWLWFGTALYHKKIVNFAQPIPDDDK